MNEKIREIVLEIQENYRNGYGLKKDEDIFYHLLEQIGKHVAKLARLKADGSREVLMREVADMYLLALGLMEIEGVDEKILKASADYYLNKVKENVKNE